MNDASVRRVLRRVLDPEVGINIIDLGIVHQIEVSRDAVDIGLTMTSLACPLHQVISDSIRSALRAEWPVLQTVRVRLLSEPAWTPDCMSDEARGILGWD